jgi:hypothetical protein
MVEKLLEWDHLKNMKGRLKIRFEVLMANLVVMAVLLPASV